MQTYNFAILKKNQLNANISHRNSPRPRRCEPHWTVVYHEEDDTGEKRWGAPHFLDLGIAGEKVTRLGVPTWASAWRGRRDGSAERATTDRALLPCCLSRLGSRPAQAAVKADPWPLWSKQTRGHCGQAGKPRRQSSPRPLGVGPAGGVPGLTASGSSTGAAAVDRVLPEQRAGRWQTPGLCPEAWQTPKGPSAGPGLEGS